MQCDDCGSGHSALAIHCVKATPKLQETHSGKGRTAKCLHKGAAGSMVWNPFRRLDAVHTHDVSYRTRCTGIPYIGWVATEIVSKGFETVPQACELLCHFHADCEKCVALDGQQNKLVYKYVVGLQGSLQTWRCRLGPPCPGPSKQNLLESLARHQQRYSVFPPLQVRPQRRSSASSG